MHINAAAFNVLAINAGLSGSTVIPKYLDDVLYLGTSTAQRNWFLMAENTLSCVDEFIKTSTGRLVVSVKNDSVIISDQSSKSRYVARWALEQLILTDTWFKALLKIRGLSENTALNDSLMRSFVRGIVQNDAVPAMTDALMMSKLFYRYSSDVVVTVDNALKSRARFVSNSDVITLTDALFSAFIRVKNVTDNVLLVDAFTKSLIGSTTISRALSDAFSLNDANVFRDWAVFLNASAITTDYLTAEKAAGNVRSKLFDESVAVQSDDHWTMTDLASNDFVSLMDFSSYISTGHVFRIFGEGLLLVDDVRVIRDRTFVDFLRLNDVEGRYSALAMIADEDMSLPDAAIVPGSGSTQTKNFGEWLTPTDAPVRTIRRNRWQSDPLLLSDTSIPLNARFRVFTESVLAGDNVAFSQQVIRWLAETLALVDQFTGLTGKLSVRVLADSILVSDGSMRFQIYFRALPDGLALSDAAAYLGRKSIAVSDAIQVTDSVMRVMLLTRNVQEFISVVTDSKLLEKLVTRIDGLAIADQRTTFVTRVRALVDSLGLPDEVKRALSSSRRMNDTVLLSDELLSRFLPLLQYEVRIMLGVARLENVIGVDAEAYVGVDRGALLAVA